MSNRRSSLFRSLLSSVLVAAALIAPAAAQPIPPYVGSGPLLPLILQMPQNSWLQVNANFYSDVWTPVYLEPLDNGATHTPDRIILAWSSFAWDSNRGDLIIYGGGHANYSGNDVYRWHSSNLLWERAALPSEITAADPVIGNTAIDGVYNAPISSHTYDNNIFLPNVDRFMTWGGAAYDNGQPYSTWLESDPTQSRLTGPYLFDPNRADGNKVGGTTGSNVRRVDPTPIAGGQMWQNRDINKNIATQALPGTHVNGCTGYASEGGHDVVYTASAGRYSTSLNLYRYQITDVANPTLDLSTQVGMFSVGVTGQTTCGYDPVRKVFVRTGNNSVPFQFWDVTTPGPTNPDHSVQIDSTIASLQAWLTAQNLNIQNCAIEFDPVRGDFPLWCGTGPIWELHEPPSANTTSGWTVTQRNPSSAVPPGIIGTGIMGKWHYAPYYDVFVGLEDTYEGQIWIYKPVGWVQPNPPGNALPAVTITSPANGITVAPATPISLTANATDSDGSIARVEYYANGVKLGQATVAPYSVPWTPILVGSYAIVAVAVDNAGGMALSPVVNLTVNATLTTITMQRGLNGYAGVSDTFLDNGARTAVHGASDPLYLDPSNYNPLVRFAIYQSEGGPIPDGAVVQSATLKLYKQSYDDDLQLNALLKPWVESQATWTIAQTGSAWSVGGAAGVGTDYAATADALVTPSFNPGWVTFDVTARARQWANNASTNYGWRLSQSGGGSNLKQFSASETLADPTLRPMLTVVYSGGSSNVPPTVSLTSPADGASVSLGNTFTLTASASDDGSIAKVEYYAGVVKIGQATAAPYTFVWTPAATGSYVLTAVATDNTGLTATSNAATVTVTAVTGSTVVLQRGLNGYAGVSDTFLDNYLQTTVRGAMTPLYLASNTYTPLIRFAVFQAEGGPVPNGATIQSATLQLYKQYYDDTIRLNSLLKPWVENQATWLLSQSGAPWTAGGASGADSDYRSSADAVVSVPFNPGWVAFDVSARVQQWAGNPVGNYGWRLGSTTGPVNAKTFNSSEYATDTTLRPKLTVVYSGGGGGDIPPAVTLLTPADGATTVLGGSFTLTANASDLDGTVAKVEYYAGSLKIGQATVAPYTVAWTPAAAGTYVLTAVATDNALATTTSNAATVTVTSGATTAVLRRGLNGYSGVSDTFLDRYLQTTVRGSFNPLYLDSVNYTPLIRFAVFQSEGGPVPNGVTILSATLQLYKQYYNDTVSLNALLKPWVESQATWQLSQTGVPWTSAGASSSGSDYSSSTDAVISVPFNPGWVSFDVSTRVRQWAANSATNFGWRLGATGAVNAKTFNASEYATDPTLRPTLTIVYQ